MLLAEILNKKLADNSRNSRGSPGGILMFLGMVAESSPCQTDIFTPVFMVFGFLFTTIRQYIIRPQDIVAQQPFHSNPTLLTATQITC